MSSKLIIVNPKYETYTYNPMQHIAKPARTT